LRRRTGNGRRGERQIVRQYSDDGGTGSQADDGDASISRARVEDELAVQRIAGVDDTQLDGRHARRDLGSSLEGRRAALLSLLPKCPQSQAAARLRARARTAAATTGTEEDDYKKEWGKDL
jgi:hypothetical protein